MPNAIKISILFIICILSTGFALAAPAPLVLTSQSSGHYVNEHVEYFVDPSEKMTLDEVSRQTFIAANGKTVLAHIDHPVWFRLTLQRAPDAPASWWLDYLAFIPAELVFYSPDQNGHYSAAISGTSHPFSAKKYPYRQYLYAISFNQNQPLIIYWRATSYSAFIFPLKIWQMEGWIDSVLKSYLVYGVLTGIMLGLAFYNLILFFKLKDRLFLLYFFTVLSYVFYSINLSGLDWHILWPDQFHRFGGLSSVVIFFAAISSILFARALLVVPGQRLWFNWFLNGVVLVYFFILILVVSGQLHWADLLNQWCGAIWLPVVLGMSAYLSYRGSVWAKYYLLGESPTIIGSILLVLMTQGIIEANAFNTSFYFYAGAWSAVLFSQALAEKVHGLKRATDEALQLVVKEKTARLLQAEQSRASLEEKVQQRTKELSVEVLLHQQTAQQLRESQIRLEEMAFSDALTGLPNRRMFQDRFQQALLLAQRQEREFALAMMDLDYFKRINDSMGHGAGDQLLKIVAQRLNHALRQSDTVARLGGDEFAIIFNAPISREDAGAICQRLLDSFNEAVMIDGIAVQTSMSIGLAWYPGDGQDADSLIGAADRALYQAKAAGRHTIRSASLFR